MPKPTHSAPTTQATQKILLSNSGYAIGKKLRHSPFGVGTLSTGTLTIDLSSIERHLCSSRTHLEKGKT
jgi:hypothetical protein